MSVPGRKSLKTPSPSASLAPTRAASPASPLPAPSRKSLITPSPSASLAPTRAASPASPLPAPPRKSLAPNRSASPASPAPAPLRGGSASTRASRASVFSRGDVSVPLGSGTASRTDELRQRTTTRKFRNALRHRQRFKLVAGLAARLRGSKEAERDDADAHAGELVCNGTLIDALERLLPVLLVLSGPSAFKDFVIWVLQVRLEQGDEEQAAVLDQQESWMQDPLFKVASEMVIQEKLVATIEEYIDAFWRGSCGGARPRLLPRRWADPFTMPAARPRPGDAKADRRGATKLACYVREILGYNRHASALVHKADAYLALHFPASKKGHHKAAELSRNWSGSNVGDAATERPPVKVAISSAPKAGLERKAGPTGASREASPAIDDNSAKPFLPPLAAAQRPPALLPGSRLKGMGQTKPSWATYRLDPLSRKARLHDLPCEEVRSAPSRWLFEEGRRGAKGPPPSDAKPQSCPGGQRLSTDLLNTSHHSNWNSESPPRARSSLGGAIESSLRTGDNFRRRSRRSGDAGKGMRESNSLPELRQKSGKPRSPATEALLAQIEHSERAATPLSAACSPTKQVLHAASSGGALPNLPLYAADRFPTVAAKVRNLGSGDRVALTAEALASESVQGACIEEIDLGGNSKLEEQQLAGLIGSLCHKEASASLKKLSLRRCACAGIGTLNNVIRLLSGPGGSPALKHMDLSGVQLGLKCHIPLCSAIRAHPALREVKMSDCGLGSGVDVKRCMHDLFTSRSISVMDLSWNCFSAEVFEHVGDCLALNQSLKVLSLANCSAAVFSSSGGDDVSAAAHFAEALARDRALKRLDLSLNRIDFRGALCLEDALESNKDLQHLDMSNNPLGASGMRSVLRILAREGSAIERLVCEGCSKGYSTPKEYPWEPACPGAKYNLDLARPQDRAILRKILKLCQRLGAPTKSCILDVGPDAKFRFPEERDGWGVFELPRKGKLSFVFSLAKAMEAKLRPAAEYTSDAHSWLRKQAELLRQSVCRQKEMVLIAFWRQANGFPDKQQLVLEALSKDFLISYPLFLAVCKDEDDHLSTIVPQLLPSLASTFPRYLAMHRTMSLPSVIAVFSSSRAMLTFTPENPTGRYSLELERPCDRAIALQLMLLDAWEVLVDRSQGRPDVSQRGNGCHWRNERHMNMPVVAGAISEWNLPTSGTLDLDYVSSQRPAMSAEPLSVEVFSGVLVTLGGTQCSNADKLSCLRQVADQIFLRCMQFREALGLFRDESDRAELFVSFCFRLTDIFNWKLVRARLNDPKVFLQLQQRVGVVTFFPFVQPEQANFELDLSWYDHRHGLTILCQYLLKERRENLRDISYVRADGTMDKLEAGVPKSWEILSKIPTGGVFKGRYVCAPEHRKYEFRKEMLQAYGYWSCSELAESDVRWWYTTCDVPVDVVNLITFIMNKWDVSSPSKAFSRVVGDKPHCAFSAFEAAFAKRFGSAVGESSRRLQDIFRYLEDSGDGKVSLKEWLVLDEIWAEIRLSVQEFSQFLERTFNERVQNTWEFFDKDKSGGVSEAEWTQAVDKLGYFGPRKIIYAFLDPTGRGSLGQESFAHLANFGKSILAVDTRC